MNTIAIIAIISAILVNKPKIEEIIVVPEPPKQVFYEPNHRQKIWLGALEWCESAGVKEAINPNDSDGTPSYHSFQFKPNTFERYIKKYNIKEAPISDYDTQYLIVSQMLNDKSVKWNKEFPACVRKLGYPPSMSS